MNLRSNTVRFTFLFGMASLFATQALAQSVYLEGSCPTARLPKKERFGGQVQLSDNVSVYIARREL
jgi:hypothetical protein